MLFTESIDAALGNISVTCPSCILAADNIARNYGSPIATPPSTFVISMPSALRSGAPLPINVTLEDGFNQTVMDWVDTVATIETAAKIAGSPRVFYAHGAAVFKELTLRGAEDSIYPLVFTLSVRRLLTRHRSATVADAKRYRRARTCLVTDARMQRALDAA